MNKYSSIALSVFVVSLFGWLVAVTFNPDDATRVKLAKVKAIEEAVKSGRSVDDIQKLQTLLEKQ